MSEERWLPVPGYEGFYEVSDLGRVKSLTRRERAGLSSYRTRHGRILKLNPDGGYLRVRLCCRSYCVHSLVLMAFVGPKPDGLCACHDPDPDGTNNKLSNLQWGTYAENNAQRRPFILMRGPDGKYLPGKRDV